MSDEKLSFRKILLVLNTLTFASTQIFLFILLPLLPEKMGLPLPLIIASFSLGSFLFLWGAPFWSSKSDKIGRETVMNYGLTGLSLSFLTIITLMQLAPVLGSTVTLILLIICRVLYGSLASSIVPVAQLSFSDLAKNGEHITGMFSHSLALNTGRSLGPLLMLLGQNHLMILLYGISAWTLILLGINLLAKKDNLRAHATVPAMISWRKAASSLRLPLLLTILFTMYTGILHSSLGENLKKVFLLTGLEASSLMAKVLLLGSLVMIVSQLIGKIVLKSKLPLALGLGYFSLLLGAFTFALMSEMTHAWIAIIFVSIGIALVYPSHIALLHQQYPKEAMGKNIGLLSSGNTIGYALGGAITSMFLNFNLNYIALSIVLVFGIGGFINFQRMKPC